MKLVLLWTKMLFIQECMCLASLYNLAKYYEPFYSRNLRMSEIS